MISNKISLGGRAPVSFHKGKSLHPRIDSSLLRSWVLTNDRVSFTFLEDFNTGVRLYSWEENTFDSPIINQSKSLWTLGMLNDYKYISSTQTSFNTYVVYPRAANFQQPSVIPVQVGNVKSFTFVWTNVPYDQKKPTYTCDITLVASLDIREDSLDLALTVNANKSYTRGDEDITQSSVLNYLGFSSLVFKKDISEDVNESALVTNSVGFGYTYLNPFKHLRSPRFPRESFNYSNLGSRCYAAGQPSIPQASLNKWNYGSPGGFSIPAMVVGNRGTKEGTLIYGLDQEGTNPKSWQFYCDDSNLFIKTAHTSDHAFDPYGVGGYTNSNPLINYSLQNKPTWTLRIHPFKSPTRWVDWYGYELYRDTVIPKQTQFGWLPDSFYNRYLAGDISKSAAEIPMVLNTFGYMTGYMDEIVNAAQFYRDLYIESINPNFTINPIIPIHYQTAELNYDPNRNTNPSSPNSAYGGWEPWAMSGTGVSVTGPEPYKAPDYTHVNDKHTGALATLAEQGFLTYAYNIFPFTISSGSVWTQTYSGLDLIGKALDQESLMITNDMYRQWAYSGLGETVFDLGFSTCFVPEVSRAKNRQIASTLGQYGLQAYHDTLGAYGRGCVARSHVHFDPEDGIEVITTHPRSQFSRYYNQKQVEYLQDWSDYSTSGYTQFLSANPSSTAISPQDWKMGQSSEFPCDLNIKTAPITILYEVLGPIFAVYGNPVDNPRSDATSNNLLGVPVDNQSDSYLETIIDATNIEYWACTVEPPNWIQRCPMYSVALNDRTIQNEWQGVYSTNAAPLFYKAAAPTGVGAYGQLFFDATGSEERQAMDWASFSVTQWPYTNRMSMWHVSNQQGFRVPAYSGIIQDENDVLQSGVWSGYTNSLITRMLRIQAYNPDYMYHGGIMHPLDIYSVERSEEAYATIRAFRSQHPNLESGSSVVRGDEKITHFVRKHRHNGNLLFVAGNWFSGDSVFSGMFEPESYGVTNGYQVYSLDVNTVNHGTKTLESIVEAGESFNIDITLSQYDYKVYEIEVNQAVLDNTVFADLQTDFAKVAYEYDVQSVTADSLSLAYSYGSSSLGELSGAMVGFRAPSTQQILNNLPQWMKMRQSVDSDGWKLTNSWGMALERVIENAEKNTLNLNLITTETYPLSKLGYIDVTSTDLLQPAAPRNILFNSSFAIKDVSRSMMPAGWERYGNTQVTRLSNKGSNITCASLVSSDGTMRVGQEVILGGVLIKKMYASVYILCDAPSTDVTLNVSVEHIDGTNNAMQAKLRNRSTEWVRLVLPINVNQQVYRINFSVTSLSNAEVSISAPQLEVAALSPWSKSSLDVLPYLPYGSRFNLVYAQSRDASSKRIPIHHVGNENEFIYVNIPTRIEKVSKPVIDLDPYSSLAFGRKVDQLGEIVRTEFIAYDSQIVERAISPTPWDMYGRYSIKDLRFYEELSYGTRDDDRVSIVPVASAVRNDMLYVICRETAYGSTNYVVKIIQPRTPPNGETYLESIVDFNINLSFNKTFVADGSQVSEEVYSISFSDIDPTYMIVTSTNNISTYYKLYFDYYYFNDSKNRLYLVETYTDANISVI